MNLTDYAPYRNYYTSHDTVCKLGAQFRTKQELVRGEIPSYPGLYVNYDFDVVYFGPKYLLVPIIALHSLLWLRSRILRIFRNAGFLDVPEGGSFWENAKKPSQWHLCFWQDRPHSERTFKRYLKLRAMEQQRRKEI